MNRPRPTNPEAGVQDTLADLIRLFEEATASHHPASDAYLANGWEA
jgi:hypothetical protein